MEPASGGGYVRAVLGQWGGWTRRHLALTVLLSAGAFVFGWLWNTYVMAVNLQGSVIDPGQQTVATAQGQAGNGLFWLIFFGLLAGLITYGWQRGWRTLFADLGAIPRSFAAAVSDSAGGAFALLLWGVSVSLIISTLISSAVSLALGLVLLVLAASPLGVILNFALIRIWKGLCAIVAPQARQGSVLSAAPFVTMVGEALGLLADWLLNSWILGLVLGVVCAVVSVVLSRNAWRPSAGVALVVVGMSVAFAVLRARGAWADDGGWQECMTSSGEPCSQAGIGGIFAWFGSEGSGTVMAHAAIGGASAGVGAAVGAGLGGAAAGMAGVGAASAAGLAGGSQGGSSTSHQERSAEDRLAADPSGAHAASTSGQTASSIPHQAGPSEAGDHHAGTPTDPDATVRTSGLGSEGPTVPQRTAGLSLEDYLPEPPDRSEEADTPADPDATARLSGEGLAGPTVPQQAGGLAVEDFLPEPPDRDEQSGSGTPSTP